MATGAPARLALERLLRPRSIAIIGASGTPGSLGESVLSNLERAEFAGDLYLVNPKRAEIRGRTCLSSADALPEGIDCAVLAIPRTAVADALLACGRRKAGSAIIFSAGYAESGAEGRAEQERIAQIARDCRMIVEGPNCLGMVNGIDRIALTFVRTPAEPFTAKRAVAIVSQSGAMAAVLAVSLRHHGIGISYSVSTGNEAATGVEDYVEYLIDDERTHAVAMIVELFRQPSRFLALVRRARDLGKYIVLLHPGRGSAARESAATHTGAMAGDYTAMRTAVEHAGVVVVQTLEELVDVSQMLVRCSALPRGGIAVLTESGAFKAMTLDFCESVGLEVPPLSVPTASALRAALPAFIPVSNPLDVTAQGLVDPDLYRRTIAPLAVDERYGSLVLGIILTDEDTCHLKMPAILDGLRASGIKKPVIFSALDEGASIPRSYLDELRVLGVPFFPSPERAFRALAALASLTSGRTEDDATLHEMPVESELPSGVIPEYRSKQILAQTGIPVPPGGLARSAEEAMQIAERVGYPVALKAQSPQLSHKTDAGGVVLDVRDKKALALAWQQINENTAGALQGMPLDGVLVERMAKKGLELIVGARNNPGWGPMVLVGFGGVLAEVLRDVRVFAPTSDPGAIAAQLNQLRAATLLHGVRGGGPADVSALSAVVARVSDLIRSMPSIREIDINPVAVYGRGQGAVALDALIVRE